MLLPHFNSSRTLKPMSLLSRLLVVPALLLPLLPCRLAHAQSLESFASIGLGNETISPSIYSLNSQFDPTGALVSASAFTSFSGVDSQNANQTMTYSGSATGRAEYGRLHTYVTAVVGNPYYNASNPVYYNANDPMNPINPMGTPDYFGSQGFTEFTDTLQFGGSLPASYKAGYLFHLDGLNSGSDAGAFLAVKIGSDPTEFYHNTDPGMIVVDWGTQSHNVNGITPDTVDVQFSSQFNSLLQYEQEGVDFSGTADFAATLTLTGIELTDANGNLLSGWTVTSASGTQYNTIQGSAVPEPGAMALLLGLLVPATALLKKRK